MFLIYEECFAILSYLFIVFELTIFTTFFLESYNKIKIIQYENKNVLMMMIIFVVLNCAKEWRK